jgi:hypothetical protein
VAKSILLDGTGVYSRVYADYEGDRLCWLVMFHGSKLVLF